MDTSSEGSFAWTDASSDTIDSAIMVNDNMNKTHSDEESISGKVYKKKLQEELFAQSNGDAEHAQPHERTRRKRKLSQGEAHDEQASPKKKKIKREPESDVDVAGNKHNINGENHKEFNNEHYLDLKVKAEEQFTSPPSSKTKKSKSKKLSNSDTLHNDSSEINDHSDKNIKHHSHETDVEDDKLDLLVQQENEYHEKKTKKKKKKSKKRDDSIMSNETYHQDSCLEEDGASLGGRGSIPCAEEPDANGTIPVDSVTHNLKIKDNKLNENSDEHAQRTSADGNSSLHTFNNRTPRISEMIRFEEDENSEMETSQLQSSKTSSARSSKLKTFLKNNSNLKPCTRKLKAESVLTGDDEIWIISCPRDVDIEAFQNKDLLLEGKCKLKLDGQTYEGAVDDGSANISVLSLEQSHFDIKTLSVKGCLRLRKRIPKHHIQDGAMVSNQINFIPLPETKCRHPLFGANYRKAIKLPAKVSERLQASAHAHAHAHAHAVRRALKERRTREGSDYHPLSTPKAEPSPDVSVKPELDTDHPVSSKKKKKKRKHSDSEEIAPKKRKRMKHDLESAEAWESEQAIEENLFDF